MFGLGFGEILLIAVIALLLFGDKDLPKNLKKATQWIQDFKKTSNDVQRSWYQVRDDFSRTIMTIDTERSDSVKNEGEKKDSSTEEGIAKIEVQASLDSQGDKPIQLMPTKPPDGQIEEHKPGSSEV